MQATGALSLLVCAGCILLLFVGQIALAKFAFGLSLLMAISLVISLVEIQISVNALNLQLCDLDQPQKVTKGAKTAVLESRF